MARSLRLVSTGNVSSGLPKEDFLPFEESLAMAQSLGLASSREWTAWCTEGMRPPRVPSHPNLAYKHDGWEGWGHWLGTGNLETKLFLPFSEALAVVRFLGLANRFEWRAWCKNSSCRLTQRGPRQTHPLCM